MIVITDCAPRVKGKLFCSMTSGTTASLKPTAPYETDLARFKHARRPAVNSFTPNGPIFLKIKMA